MIPQSTFAKKFTSSGTVHDGSAHVSGLIVRHGTATQSSAVLKDGGSGGTEKVGISHEAVTAAGDLTEVLTFPFPIYFSTDVYLALTGTGTVAYVLYSS